MKQIRNNLGLVILGLSLAACTEYEGQATAPEKKNFLAENGDSQASEDDSAADEPIMVGGTFFTCAVDETIAAPADRVASGCRLEDDGKKVEISKDIAASIRVYNQFNVEVSADVADAPATSQWHWILMVPLKEFKGSKVEATIVHLPSNLERQRVSVIVGEPIAIDHPEVFEYEAGSETNFLLGPAVVGPNKKEEANDNPFADAPGCKNTDQDVSSKGMIISLRFKVLSAGTQVGITLGDLCGVDLKGNRIAVRKVAQTKSLAEKELVPQADQAVMKGFVAEPGDYEVVMTGRDAGAEDYDVALMGSINFTASGEIQLGDETVVKESSTVVAKKK